VRTARVEPVREFEAGRSRVRLRHVADAWLEPEELVTFRTESGTELDLTRKAWGYYATPSLNGRLRDHGLRAALTAGAGRVYLMLVEEGLEPEFRSYLDAEEMEVVAWLDSDEAVAEATARLRT
jgi:hypothetical protein